MRDAPSGTHRVNAMLAAVPLLWSLAVPIHAEEYDYLMRPVPEGESEQPASRPDSRFQYMFGLPATWPLAVHWRYNHANAPSQYSANKAGAIQQIIAASAKWTAACGVEIVYDGETTTSPNRLTGGQPDRENVVGWQTIAGGNSAITYSWYEYGFGDRTIVDSDIVMSPRYLTSSAQIARSVSHEWGHAIGLAHSNVESTLMSGPPDSSYTNFNDLTTDDMHGCRCLYGPPAGKQAGYVCSLPEDIDFGALSVGTTATQLPVTVKNSGNGALTITAIRTVSSEFFVGTNGCVPGAALAPGASCSFGLMARLASTDVRADEATIDTSEGPYRIPLRAEGIAASPAVTANFEGAWSTAPAGSESGWGINFAHQGDVIFATWFTYDSSGRAWWLTMTAKRTADNVYEGTLYETRGPPFNAVPFSPSAVSYFAVGSGTLTFSDANNGLFAYTVKGISQAKAITRLVFGPMPVCTFAAQPNLALATNYQDVWWAAGAGESGWGVSFTHQGDVIFATWFTYDFDGMPLWFSVTAPKISAGVYGGTLYRTTGPAFNAVPFNPMNVAYTPVGNLTLTFADGNNATFAYAVTQGTPPVAVIQTKQLTRQVFRSPGTVCQ